MTSNNFSSSKTNNLTSVVNLKIGLFFFPITVISQKIFNKMNQVEYLTGKVVI